MPYLWGGDTYYILRIINKLRNFLNVNTSFRFSCLLINSIALFIISFLQILSILSEFGNKWFTPARLQKSKIITLNNEILFIYREKMKNLPKEWKYLDWGMIIATILVIAGIIFFALSIFGSKMRFIIGIILTLFGVIVTIWMAHEGTREIKRQL
jgi:hypothetical protein